MKETNIVFNVLTGKEEIIEVELTEQEIAEREKQQNVSEANRRMQEIVAELQSMDYKTSKYVDGDYSEEEWSVIVAKRKELREEYKLIEDQLELV